LEHYIRIQSERKVPVKYFKNKTFKEKMFHTKIVGFHQMHQSQFDFECINESALDNADDI